MVKKTLLLAGLAACVALYAFAGTEPTTTINGTLTNPFGATAGTGTVSCALSEAGTWDNDGTATAVTTPVSGTVASDGTVSLVLTPNDAITPTGTYWVCDWVETGVTRWRDQPVLPSDPDPIAIDGVPRRVTPPPDSIPVYAPFINRQPNYPNEIIFDSNSDTLWDVSLYDDGDNSGIILRNGLPFIQFGVGAKLKIKLCGVGLDAGFFYDEDDDGTFDAADDFCWGKGGYDQDCNCVADTGTGSGDMTKAVYDTDDDGTVDVAESSLSPQVDIDGDGTREISLVSSGLEFNPTEDGSYEFRLSSGSLYTPGANFFFQGADGFTIAPDSDEDNTGNFYISLDSGTRGNFMWDGSLPDCDGDGSALGYDVTTGTLVCGDDDTGTGDVTDVFGCASGDCNDVSVADGEQLDFSAVNNSATTEGLVLPQGTDISAGTTTGQIGYDTDGHTVYVGGSFNGLSLAVPVVVSGPQYVYAFADMLGSSAISGGAPFAMPEGSTSLASTNDANPETTSTAIGSIGATTGTTAGNESTIGLARAADTTTQQFEPRKMRLFGARGGTVTASYSRTRKLAVGGVRMSSDGNWNTKTDGIYFWCDPASDLDNDGTVGDTDSDGTGTNYPDGDCGDAGDDADDCKWYAVTMNNATDGSSGKISTSTNTTATKTTVSCGSEDLTYQTMEIAYDGSSVVFYINGASAATHSTNIPADGRRLYNWGVYVDQNHAAARTWYIDWMLYYGIR